MMAAIGAATGALAWPSATTAELDRVDLPRLRSSKGRGSGRVL
jgi:hypothetical protein